MGNELNLDEAYAALADAACAVIERWDSPAWKDLPHTGESINALRRALAGVESASVAAQGHARQQETPIKFFCHSEDAGYNEFDTLAEAAACAESMLTDARSNANLDGEWSEEETSIRYGSVIGEAVEVKQEGGGYEYSISKPSATPCQGHARQQEAEEIEQLRKDAELYLQLQRAAVELPHGWDITVSVEKDAGGVSLYDADGEEVDLDYDDASLAECVARAIDTATAQEAKSGE